jgi:prepilin-type N-terminal cleavage/methylation domain-containing protein
MLNKLNSIRKGAEEGFTIVELLVVIAIIGVLTAIAIPAFFSYTEAAAKATVKSDVKNSVTAITAALAEDGNLTFEEAQLLVVESEGNTVVVAGLNTYGYYVAGSSSDPRLSNWTYEFDSSTGQYFEGPPVGGVDG